MYTRLNLYVSITIVVLTTLLHCYPFFRGASHLIWKPPIRVLILADPHLEGDGKIARMGWRGQLDIWGNDHYLGHIHRSMSFFVRPTRTVILGDHMSSQWIDDAEFTKRSVRMEERILKWTPKEKILNITGNHDIGYAGDITRFRVNRWHERFGPTNYVVEIDATELPPHSPRLRIVGLNNLLVDGPAYDEDVREQMHTFLNSIPQPCAEGHTASSCFDGATILLMHVPMYKDDGICTDGPYMNYYQGSRILLREQNHLSMESTQAILNQVIGTRDGIVLTGHDHEGCRVFLDSPEDAKSDWRAQPYSSKSSSRRSGVEEVTVRSVMGQYGGNAGVLTAEFDQSAAKWRFQYRAVPFVHNTIWWILNIYIRVASVYLTLYYLSRMLSGTDVAKRMRQNLSLFKRSTKKERML